MAVEMPFIKYVACSVGESQGVRTKEESMRRLVCKSKLEIQARGEKVRTREKSTRSLVRKSKLEIQARGEEVRPVRGYGRTFTFTSDLMKLFAF